MTITKEWLLAMANTREQMADAYSSADTRAGNHARDVAAAYRLAAWALDARGLLWEFFDAETELSAAIERNGGLSGDEPECDRHANALNALRVASTALKGTE